LGFTGWCSHDIDPAMKGGVPLGGLNQQNRVRAAGAEQWRKNPPAVISRSVVLVIPDTKMGDAADWSIAKQCMDLVSRGVLSAIVLESRAGGKTYLNSRERSKSCSRPQCD